LPFGAFLNTTTFYKPNLIIMRLFDYIRDTKGEMKHVSWPTRNQVIGYTLIVLLISAVLAAYLGLFDYLFTNIVDKFFINNF
jgi:preprotein translocase subunit SecE